MVSKRGIVKKFNKNLKIIIDRGYVKINGCLILAAGYVFHILDEKDPLHTPENLEKLGHCKILITRDGQRYVIMRELIKLDHNPTDNKFIDINELNKL